MNDFSITFDIRGNKGKNPQNAFFENQIGECVINFLNSKIYLLDHE